MRARQGRCCRRAQVQGELPEKKRLLYFHNAFNNREWNIGASSPISRVSFLTQIPGRGDSVVQGDSGDAGHDEDGYGQLPFAAGAPTDRLPVSRV